MDNKLITQSIRGFIKERGIFINRIRLSLGCGLGENYFSNLIYNKNYVIKTETLNKIIPLIKFIGWNEPQNISAFDLDGCEFVDVNKYNDEKVEIQKEYTMICIKQKICEYFKISLEQLDKNHRKHEIVKARQIAMYFAKNLTKNSLATIGAYIGGKDHCTVLHACKTIGGYIDTDKNFKEQMQEIEFKITGKKPTEFKPLIKHQKPELKPVKDTEFIRHKGIYSNQKDTNEITFQRNSFTINNY